MTTLTERFWSKVNKNGPIHERLGTRCWVWIGAQNNQGYGSIRVDGRNQQAHRISWTMAYDDPGDLHVLHHCDNEPCVRPSHLFIGTHSDNMQDMLQKGRGNKPKGIRNQGAKLTPDQVKDIRAAYEPYVVTARSLAELYDVHEGTIKSIVQGKTWTHI